VNASGAPRPLRIAVSGALIGALQHNGPRWPANRAAAFTAQAVASPEMLAAGFLRLGARNAALLFRCHNFILLALAFGFLFFVLWPLRLRNLAARRSRAFFRSLSPGVIHF
jgi:hypothetical protein